MRKRRGILQFFIALAATIIIVLATATVTLGVFVNRSDLIFPNVSAEGINVSAMTVVEADRRLVSMGFENNASTVSVTVNFPYGSSFSISGNDAGLSLCAEEVALAAFEHGRYGSFIGRTLAYVRSLWETTNIYAVAPVPDKNFVRDEVAIHTQQFNNSLIRDSVYSIDEYSITITPGMAFAFADEESVFNLVVETLYAALEERTHLTVYYMPPLSDSAAFNLNELHNKVHVEPIQATLDPQTFAVTESADGISFDIDLAAGLLQNAAAGEQIVIPLIFAAPEITTAYLQEKLFRDVLASRTTNVAGNAARLNNIQIAASYIHDLVLKPGDVFSFNGIVGRSTEARGFLPAGGFRDGQLVDMVGGGICQVASSLYDNVLHAHLEVVQRRAHSLPITYLPLGHDAAIYYGQLDLRFRNNTEYPIRIEFEFEGRYMTSRLVGTRTNDYVIRIESNSTPVPFETVYRVDGTIPYGESAVYFTGRNGFIAYTYRRIYDGDGNRISRTRIARDVYRTQSRIVLIPPTPVDAPYSQEQGYYSEYGD